MSSRRGQKNNKENPPKGGSSLPPPQLAREIYTLDDSSDNNENDFDDSGDESLEIIMPKKKEMMVSMKQEKEQQPKEHAKKYLRSKEASSPSSSSETNLKPEKDKNDNTKKKRKLGFNAPDLGDSSSDDDDLKELLAGNIGIRKKKQATTKVSSAAAVAAKKNRNNNNNDFSLSSQSSDDDENKEDEKSRMKRERELARWQKKQEATQKKEAEKRVRAQQREDAKLKKERAKQLEKEQKRQQKELVDQSAGKFSHKEMVVLIDRDLYNNPNYALVDTFSNDFLLHSHESTLPCQAIQWIRKDYLQGGAEDALQRFTIEQQGRGNAAAAGDDDAEQQQQQMYEHLSQVMMILEADDFLPLLQRVDNHHIHEGDIDVDIDFPKLKVWLDSLISRWKIVWKKNKYAEKPKLLLLLHQIPEALDKLWVDYSRKNNSKKSSSDTTTLSSPPTEWDFQDAMHWLLIHHQVETVLCENIESIQSNFHKMTRGLAEAQYAEQVTELQCIKKIKGCGSNDDFVKAKDVWMRQLRMLPGVSETKARNLAQSYPTMLSLWQTYQENGDDNENENRLLLEQEFTTNTRQVKLSDSLYRVMTSDNPNEMIL